MKPRDPAKQSNRFSLLDWVLPDVCLGCRLRNARTRGFGLCLVCEGKLVRCQGGCFHCGEPLGASALRDGLPCLACQRRPPAYERLAAAWLYRAPLDAVVRAIKLGRRDDLARRLGRAMAPELVTAWGDAQLLVPVPLHWTRRWMRGFDQAEELVIGLSQASGLPWKRALRRARRTRRQTSLGRGQRLGNPRGVFRLAADLNLRGMRVVLVDDVVTTGSTLRSAAEVLAGSGAIVVAAVAAARTERRR